MSQYNSRFQSNPPKAPLRESEVKLRTSPEAYAQEKSENVYARRQQDSQKIKNMSFWDNTDQETGEENEWSERQSPTPFILVMIILVVASTLLWFLFQWASGDHSSSPPIIAADTAPFKVRPENPGGMMIPHQDKLVYGRLSQDSSQPIERLLPPPEQPMASPPMAVSGGPAPLQQQGFAPQTYNAPSQQGYAPNPAMQQGPQFQSQPSQGGLPHPQGVIDPRQANLQPQQGAPQVQQGAPQLQQGMPHPQQAAPYQPYSSQPPYPQPIQGQPPYPTSAQPQAPYGPPAPPMPAPAPPTHQIPLKAATNASAPEQPSAVEGIKPAQDTEDEADTGIQKGQSELDLLIAKEAAIPLKRSAKKSTGKQTRPMAMDSGKHKVQIASLPSRAMAEKEMKRLQNHHAAVFENKPWNIQKINLGPDRGFTYRLVVGSFGNRNAATKFCKKLGAEKIGCLVVPPANE